MWLTKAHISQEAPTSTSGSSSLILSLKVGKNMENNLLFMTIVLIIMFILHTAGFIWSLKKIGKGFYKLF